MSTIPAKDASPAPGSPVGNGGYVVQDGDCLESIAFDHGHIWQTIWDHAQNAELKSVRNPNVLLPGDRLFVPEIVPKFFNCATDQQHRFVLKRILSRVRIQVLEWVLSDDTVANSSQSGDDTGDESGGGDPPAPESSLVAKLQPRAGVPYALKIGTSSFSGTTDGDGWIEHQISPGARDGALTLEPGTPVAQQVSVVMGGLDPIDARSGIRQRLAHLGFNPGSDNPESDTYIDAVNSFQQACGLTQTGTVNDDTLQKIQALHTS